MAVRRHGQPIRRRLIDPDCPHDFSVLTELRADGITDYLVSPLRFTNGDVHAVTWATRAPDGFSPAAIAGLEAVVSPLAKSAMPVPSTLATCGCDITFRLGNTA